MHVSCQYLGSQFICFSVINGVVLFCRDKSEPLKELTVEEKAALERAETSR